jgi:hypothetical protein
MTLSKQAIDDFKKIYFSEYGVHLTDEQAHEVALRFLRNMKIVYRPIPLDAVKEDKKC